MKIKQIAILLTILGKPSRYRRGSPLVEESIILGLALFAFMILAAIVFDLVEFAKSIFEQVSDGIDRIP